MQQSSQSHSTQHASERVSYRVIIIIVIIIVITIITAQKIIFLKLLFSVAPVIFVFVLSVYTITLERLNQSKPNFHTRILAKIARPCTKMGITGHM